jgi:hypothetical protein
MIWVHPSWSRLLCRDNRLRISSFAPCISGFALIGYSVAPRPYFMPEASPLEYSIGLWISNRARQPIYLAMPLTHETGLAYLPGPRKRMENDPQKWTGRNEPPKRRNRYTIVGLNRILDVFFQDLKHELRWSTLNGIQWKMPSMLQSEDHGITRSPSRSLANR